MTKNKTLLPSGFRDLLPAEAQKENLAIRKVQDLCHSYGYMRVRPPLVEFEEALFSDGPGAFVKEQAFRFVDPISQKMMALRFDITTQIARIATTRLSEETRPLRLMYANDVIRAKSSQQRLDRQFCQIGCELISAPNPQADLEIAVLSLQALNEISVENITIDISYTKLLHLTLESCGIIGADKDQWLEMLASKDMAALEARPEGFSRALAAVVSACGAPEDTIAALRGLDNNADALACIAELESLHRDLKLALSQLGLDNVQITLDPFETKGFQYHSGICFTLFAENATAEIGRGGRYDIQGGQSACGFTLYMDMVMPVANIEITSKILLVAEETSWQKISELRAQGWIVTRALSGYDGVGKSTHILKDNKIIEN